MSERRGQRGKQERAPYLYVVGRQGGEATVPRPQEDAGAAAGVVVESARQAEAFSQAPMYACVSWVALVREQTAQSVELTPIGELSYGADVLLADSGERLLLRVGRGGWAGAGRAHGGRASAAISDELGSHAKQGRTRCTSLNGCVSQARPRGVSWNVRMG